MPELELVRLEFLLLAVETIGVLVLDSLDKFNSRIIESSAHAFLDLPRFIFLRCGPRAFRFGSTKLEMQTTFVYLFRTNSIPELFNHRPMHFQFLRPCPYGL